MANGIRVADDAYALAAEMAKREDRSITNVITRAIRYYCTTSAARSVEAPEPQGDQNAV